MCFHLNVFFSRENKSTLLNPQMIISYLFRKIVIKKIKFNLSRTNY